MHTGAAGLSALGHCTSYFHQTPLLPTTQGLSLSTRGLETLALFTPFQFLGTEHPSISGEKGLKKEEGFLAGTPFCLRPMKDNLDKQNMGLEKQSPVCLACVQSHQGHPMP